MEGKSAWDHMKKHVDPYIQGIKQAPELLYIFLISLFFISVYVRRIYWKSDLYSNWYSTMLTVLFSLVIWGAAGYLLYGIALGKKVFKHSVPYIFSPLPVALGAFGYYYLIEATVNIYYYEPRPIMLWLVGTAVAIGLLGSLLSRFMKGCKAWILIPWGIVLGALTAYFAQSLTLDSYDMVMEIYFLLMIIGKNYKKVLRWLLGVPLLTLAVAGLGVVMGFTDNIQKPNNVSPGNSLGIIYPNTWGYIAFQALIILWYLYLRRKQVLNFLVFWGTALFMYFYVSCRTIAVLTAIFPLFAMIADHTEKRANEKALSGKGTVGIGGYLLTALPILCYAITLLLGWQMEWIHRTLYPTPLQSMAMRFVQGGIALQYYGFPFVGVPMYSVTTVLNGVKERLSVMDNAYSTFTIIRGMIWMIPCLLLLTYVQWKAVKNRDYRIATLGAFFLVFALMERPGLELWYNFTMLYPLASILPEKKMKWKFWRTEPETITEG